MQFSATLQLDGQTATGVRVPDEIVTALGAGNRPPVRVTLGGFSSQTTVARMRGELLAVEGAETPETRDRRIAKIPSELG